MGICREARRASEAQQQLQLVQRSEQQLSAEATADPIGWALDPVEDHSVEGWLGDHCCWLGDDWLVRFIGWVMIGWLIIDWLFIGWLIIDWLGDHWLVLLGCCWVRWLIILSLNFISELGGYGQSLTKWINHG